MVAEAGRRRIHEARVGRGHVGPGTAVVGLAHVLARRPGSPPWRCRSRRPPSRSAAPRRWPRCSGPGRADDPFEIRPRSSPRAPAGGGERQQPAKRHQNPSRRITFSYRSPAIRVCIDVILSVPSKWRQRLSRSGLRTRTAAWRSVLPPHQPAAPLRQREITRQRGFAGQQHLLRPAGEPGRPARPASGDAAAASCLAAGRRRAARPAFRSSAAAPPTAAASGRGGCSRRQPSITTEAAVRHRKLHSSRSVEPAKTPPKRSSRQVDLLQRRRRARSRSNCGTRRSSMAPTIRRNIVLVAVLEEKLPVGVAALEQAAAQQLGRR